MCLNVDSKSYVKFLRQYCFSFQTELFIVSTVFCKHVEKLNIFLKKLFQDLHILWAMSIGFLKTQYCLAGCSDWSTVCFRMCVQLKATPGFSTSFLLKAQWYKTLKTKQKKKKGMVTSRSNSLAISPTISKFVVRIVFIDFIFHFCTQRKTCSYPSWTKT